jgi:hypothetical protein
MHEYNHLWQGTHYPLTLRLCINVVATSKPGIDNRVVSLVSQSGNVLLHSDDGTNPAPHSNPKLDPRFIDFYAEVLH